LRKSPTVSRLCFVRAIDPLHMSKPDRSSAKRDVCKIAAFARHVMQAD